MADYLIHPNIKPSRNHAPCYLREWQKERQHEFRSREFMGKLAHDYWVARHADFGEDLDLEILERLKDLAGGEWKRVYAFEPG